MLLPKFKKTGQQRLLRTQRKATELSAYFAFMPLRIPTLTPVRTIVQVEIKVCIHQTATLVESSFSFTRPHHPSYKKINKKEQEKRWNFFKEKKNKALDIKCHQNSCMFKGYMYKTMRRWILSKLSISATIKFSTSLWTPDAPGFQEACWFSLTEHLVLFNLCFPRYI